MTSAYLDESEYRVKKERLDEMDEMLNDEMPMTIEIPDGDDAEVDPLMPIPPVQSEDIAEYDKFPAYSDNTQPVIKQESDLPGDGFGNESSGGLGIRAEIKSEDESDSISIVEDCDSERIHEGMVDLAKNGLQKPEVPIVSNWPSRQITQVVPESLKRTSQTGCQVGDNQLDGQVSGLARRLIPSEIEQVSSNVSLLNQQPSFKRMPTLIPIRPTGVPTGSSTEGSWPTLSSLPSAAPAIPAEQSQSVIQRVKAVVPAFQQEIPAVPTVNGATSEPAGQTVTSINQGTLQILESVCPSTTVIAAPTAPTGPAVQAVKSPRQSMKTQPLPIPASISSVRTEPSNPPDRMSTEVAISVPLAATSPKGAIPTVPAAGPSLQGQKVRPNKKSVSVSQMLKNPFTSGRWTSEQQLAILTLPRPTPDMESSSSVSTKSLYDNNPWLCGCMKLQKFFCWPCLLFLYHSPESMVWCVPATAVTMSEIFAKTLQAHEVSDQHQEAQKKFSSWLESNTPSRPSEVVKKRYRNLQVIEKVRKNRKLLSLLVQSICHLKQHSDDAQIEAYYECFAHVVRTSKELQGILRDFQGDTSPESIAAFIASNAQSIEESVKTFIRNFISDELKNARFVTLFFEDFSSIVDISTVAVIAHFIDQTGDIQQRVIELMEINEDRSAGKIFQLVQTLVLKHVLGPKLAGYTYNATFVNPAEIADFNEKMEALCCKSRFFHYQNHDVIGMLFGALSHMNKTSTNFFHTITALRDFFNKHLVSSFHHYELTKSKPSYFEYDFDYQFVTTLRRCYPTVLQTLGSVLQFPADWDEEVASQAPIFMAFLQDTTNRFLIVLVSQLSLSVWDLGKALKGKSKVEWKLHVDRTLSNFLNILTYGFEDIYGAAVSPILVKNDKKTSYEKKGFLVNLFQEVIHTGMQFLQQRFSTSDFGYVDLDPNLVVDNDRQHCQKRSDYFSRLCSTPDQVENMKVEVHHVKMNPMLQNKTLVGSLKCFYDFNLAKALPAYAEFLDFAVTVPSSQTILHCPMVERIQAYRLNHTRKPIPEETVWMEKELLAEIAKSKKLCEAVIDVFTSSDVANDFSYGKEARAYLGFQ